MKLAAALIAAIALGACFNPSFKDTTCGVNESCPPGFMCIDGVCRTDGVPTDGPPPTATLTITRGGTGTGAVTSAPAGIDCGATCTNAFTAGTQVTLTAAPGTGATFTGWSGGGCTGTGACTVTLDADTTVNADFALTMHTVTVVRGGNGSGTVTSTPAGISCGATCTTSVAYGTQLTLAQTAAAGSIFLGWSGGGCAGTADCTVTVTGDVTVNASFGLNFSLVVTKTGNGQGGVTSAPAGINCGADCDEVYVAGTMVTLTANPSVTSTFSGWSGGGCSGAGTCVVTVSAAVAVNADFALRRYTLTAALAGPGGGTITSTPAGINCGSDCTEPYDHGTSVSLTATPNGISTFTGWSGACTGTGTCMVTMDMARSVTATFAQQAAGFTVTRAGTGTGTVTSSPAGINCGADCTENYPLGTMVTLTAAPAVGSTFTSWSGGGCTGSGTCVITTSAAVTVTATFTLNTYVLTVAKNGTGAGTVTGTGINCGVDCTETLGHGTMVTLTAAATTGSTLTAWSGGGCTGAATTCVVTLTAATTVTATFTLNQYTLTVSKPGNGFGTVTGTGINCGADCTELMNHGSMVTLTAVALNTPISQDSSFLGWSGAGCSGTGTCTVTMTAATTVVATFSLDPNYAFVTSTTTTGNIGGLAGADAMCQARATAGGLPGTYRAWLSSDTVTALSRIGSAGGWIRPDGKVFARSQADLVAGRQIYPMRIIEDGSDVGSTTTFTGTNLDGTRNTDYTSCANWTSAANLMIGDGNTSSLAQSWTDYGYAFCNSAYRLNCLGIDRAGSLPPLATVTGRRAFISSTSFNIAGGIAAADAICTSDAAAAGLSGTYRAMLATVGASAASRFNTTGQFVRPDNAVIAQANVFFTATYWDTAINMQADGSVIGATIYYSALSGAATMNTAGTATSTCNNWSSTTGMAPSGSVDDSWVPGAFGNYDLPCSSTGLRHICLQL